MTQLTAAFRLVPRPVGKRPTPAQAFAEGVQFGIALVEMMQAGSYDAAQRYYQVRRELEELRGTTKTTKGDQQCANQA
jgi:hypothetical protein